MLRHSVVPEQICVYGSMYKARTRPANPHDTAHDVLFSAATSAAEAGIISSAAGPVPLTPRSTPSGRSAPRARARPSTVSSEVEAVAPTPSSPLRSFLRLPACILGSPLRPGIWLCASRPVWPCIGRANVDWLYTSPLVAPGMSSAPVRPPVSAVASGFSACPGTSWIGFGW
ncbi:08d31479-244b-43aa-b552-f04d42213a30 [Thermothielavioides terrestris]|uniref:08d31479-244b-43aa-b552-f04d42213a30 n=1 Tax=Thermothielavioides terrestris TaxID=2587410 RepID=A0A3S4B1M1_9PEZI|nr:08d31479-244b-43aa-b552-f04d42213a30 [Thermothielavioides terrestris]